MEEGDLVERFFRGRAFFGGRAEIGNSSVFFLVPKKKGTLGASGALIVLIGGSIDRQYELIELT